MEKNEFCFPVTHRRSISRGGYRQRGSSPPESPGWWVSLSSPAASTVRAPPWQHPPEAMGISKLWHTPTGRSRSEGFQQLHSVCCNSIYVRRANIITRLKRSALFPSGHVPRLHQPASGSIRSLVPVQFQHLVSGGRLLLERSKDWL